MSPTVEPQNPVNQLLSTLHTQDPATQRFVKILVAQNLRLSAQLKKQKAHRQQTKPSHRTSVSREGSVWVAKVSFGSVDDLIGEFATHEQALKACDDVENSLRRYED